MNNNSNQTIEQAKTLCCWCDKVALKCNNGLSDSECKDNACMDHKENHDVLCTSRLIKEAELKEGLIQ